MIRKRNNNTGKNSTYAQGKIKLFTLQHVVLCESCFLAVLRCSGKMKIKNITMVDFSATNTLYVPNKYEHMNSQNDPYGLQLKAMNVA